MTAADQIRVLLDDYGPPVPSLLPWLARWATRDDLPQVARAAATQAALAPGLRWAAVADAVAEVLAQRAEETPASGALLVDVLPQIAGHLTRLPQATLLNTGPRAEALGYAALARTSTGLIEQARLRLTGAPWPEILAAAQARVLPPLANLRMLAMLVAEPPVPPGDLLGWEAAYLVPFLPAEPGEDGPGEVALSHIEDYIAPETGWYAAALCARVVPYLDQSQRARLISGAAAAPPSWAGVLRMLAEPHREPWPSATSEVAASHPAMPRLIELANRVDQAELGVLCTQLTGEILRDYGDPDLERWEPAGFEQEEAPRRGIISPDSWHELRQVPLSVPDDLATDPAPVRYLVGECPKTVPAGKPFSLLVAIRLTGARGAALLPFDVPAEGRNVNLVLVAPELRILGEHAQRLHVPRDADSAWAQFTLQADTPGRRSVSVIAVIDGTPLGGLAVDVAVTPDSLPGPARRVRSEVGMEPTSGAVSLMARREPGKGPGNELYRFNLFADGYLSEVKHTLEFNIDNSIQKLIKDLGDLARKRRVYDDRDARRFLTGIGAGLWRKLVPGELRGQFWELHPGIDQLTILANNDVVPWEVLYPKDRGHDHGFLVEQFPVTRAILSRRLRRRLRLRPARFVLPPKSPPHAVEEVNELRQLLGETAADAIVTDLSELLDLLQEGDFGVLHFACHNTFDPVAGSAIRFDKKLFTSELLESLVIDETLADSAPLVFINACQSGSQAASFNMLEGWATQFVAAGAAAFIGSLWAVADETAPEFAAQVYRRLMAGFPLGQAVMSARTTVASGRGTDPTWLAYSVYGDPQAAVS